MEPDQVETTLKKRKVEGQTKGRPDEVRRAGTLDDHTKDTTGNTTGVEGVDYKVCPNCKHKLPLATVDLHVVGCERRNWYCSDCNVVVPKGEKDKHLAEFHSQCVCEGCGESMQKRLVAAHKANDCAGRIVSCTICQLKMQYRQLWQHDQVCGSVTEVCPLCKVRFPRRDLESHSATCTGSNIPKSPSIKPYHSPLRTANYNSSPSRYVPPNRDDVFLCEECHSPFQNFDDLQMHFILAHRSTTDSVAISPSAEPEKEQNTNTTTTLAAASEDKPSTAEDMKDVSELTEYDSTEAQSSDGE